MENAITAGLARQIVLTRALEATANNIANVSTAGFKAERVAFREYLAALSDTRAGDRFVSLVYDSDSYTDFSAGGFDATSSALDFAIEGDGFFAIETESGVAYTRDGRFSLNSVGELVGRSGGRVLDASGSPLLIDPDLGPLALSNDGALQQNGGAVGTIGVFRFEDPRVLEKRGDNLFVSGEEPEAVESPRLRQGFVETSNVASITAITDMIEIMRAYEHAARLIEASNELSRETVRTLSAQT